MQGIVPNNFIGWAGLKYVTEPFFGINSYYDLGYRLIKQFLGKGFATETALASVAYARDRMKLTELYGRASIDNLASRRVLEKTGMKFLGNDDVRGISCAFYILEL